MGPSSIITVLSLHCFAQVIDVWELYHTPEAYPSRYKIGDVRFEMWDFRLQIVDCRLRIADLEFRNWRFSHCYLNGLNQFSN